MFRTGLLITVVSALLATTAFAQRAKTRAPVEEEAEPETRFHRRTVLDMSEEQIKGTVKGPQGTVIKGRPKARFTPRIPLRPDFRAEMLGSVGQL